MPFARFQRRLSVVLCGLAILTLSADRSAAQQINFPDFNAVQNAAASQTSTSCTAASVASGVLFCLNSETGTGFTDGLNFLSDSSYTSAIDPGESSATNYALQLTGLTQNQTSSVWYSTPQNVASGFTVWYAVKFTYSSAGTDPSFFNCCTADGLAFVIQNAAGGKTDSITNTPETGSGLTVVGGGGGAVGYGGIDNSVALEMDTFFDSGWDPNDSLGNDGNHMALQSCGPGVANSPAHLSASNCLITLGGVSTLVSNPKSSATGTTVSMADGNPHQVVIVYNGPSDLNPNTISVYLDPTFNAGTHTPVAGSTPVFSGPFDITQHINLNNGNAYVGFTAANGFNFERHELMGFSYTPHGYGDANVCPVGQNIPAPCSETLPVTFSVTQDTPISSIQVVTQGTPNLDFTQANGGNCSGTISAGNSCTLYVTFTPTAPGLRLGAVQLLDSSHQVLATKLIYGVGHGPAIAFSPGTPTTVNTSAIPPPSLSVPNGVAVDAAGNVFISDSGNHRVVEVPASGTPTTVGFNLVYPQGLAVDGAGDLFIADNDQNEVFEVPAGCVNSTCQKTVGTGLRSQLGVAVDGTGDVFISDFNDGEVVEVPANGGPQTVVYSPGTGSTPVAGSNPIGLAVDAAGDLFIADFGLAKVVEIPAGCTSTSCQTTVGTGWFRPEAVAVDAAGDVFVADEAPKVVEVPAGCVGNASNCQITISNDLAYGVGVDGKGNIFIPDRGAVDVTNNQVVEINQSQPPSLSFPSTNLGFSSAPQTVTLQNIGNQPLVAISPGWFLTSPDFQAGQPIDCSTFSLAPGAFCQQNFVFWPVSSTGPLSANLVFVDNALNGSPAQQSLSLSGTALNAPQMLTVTGAGTGNGSVSSSPTGINCNVLAGVASGACSAQFTGGTQVGLQEIPSAGFVFTGWGGAGVSCGGNQQCIVTVGAATSVSASFSLVVPTTGPVPSVVGLTQDAATTAINAAQLVLGTVSAQTSSTVAAGTVISQTPAATTIVSFGSAVNLVVSSGQAPTVNPLTLQNNYFVTGDYVAAGVSAPLRGTGHSGLATGTITIASSASGGNAGVPDGADILAAYLYWETIENTPLASGGSGTFRGYAITGQQIGGDLPNPDGTSNGTLRVYRADVNAYLPAPGTNGIRFASGTHSISLPDSGGNGFPIAEGASLVVIYRVLSPNFPLKSVVIYDGSAAGPAMQTIAGFYDALVAPGGAPAEYTNLFATTGGWNNVSSTVSLAPHASSYNATLSAGNAYAAVILSTPVTNSDNDGILDAWKSGPLAGDPNNHAGQPGYYDVKTGLWVPLPGALHGQKDLFVQLDYMCGTVNADGTCSNENLFPSPDTNGKDPLAMVQQAFAANGVQLHLEIGNAVPEDTCTDIGSQLCEFPGQPGVISWKNSLEISKLWPRNLSACALGGDCSPRFAYGQKDSYHYVLFGHSLAIPAWNSRYGTLVSINAVAGGQTTIVTADRGNGINLCPSRITLSGVLGNPGLNGVYPSTSCPDSKTIVVTTPTGVSSYNYPNSTLPEPVIGLTSGTITSISGYSDLGGSDSAVTLGLWLTAPNQDMSKRANVIAGTLFHEIGHTIGLSHGGLYYDSGNYVPTFEANCKPNYQSSMNYLFQLDGVGPNQAVAFSNQALTTLDEDTAGSITQLTGPANAGATFPTSAWYVPFVSGVSASPATLHCDGTPLNGKQAYRVDASIAPITPAWSNGQDINFDGQDNVQMRGYSDRDNIDLRQVGATGGEFASLANVLSFATIAPQTVNAGGTIALGSGGTVVLGSGGTVALGSGGTVTLGSGGTIALGSGGTVTLGSGGTVVLGSGGTVGPGSSGGTIALGSGGTVTISGSAAISDGGTITNVPSTGGIYSIGSGGTIALGSGGTVALGSGGTVTLGSGGTIALGSGGTVALGSGGTVALGSGGTVTLGSGGTVTLGSGGTVTLGSGGTVTLGSGGAASGGTIALGSGGTVALGSGGTVTLGSGGNVTVGGSSGTIALGSGGTIALGSGGTVTLPAGGTVTLGSGGTIALGSGGTPTVVGPGVYNFSAGGTIALGSGGTVALGSGGTVVLGSGGTITLGSGGTIALGSGGTVTLGSGGTVALGSGGLSTLGGGGTIALGSGGTVALGSGGTIALGSGGTVALGSGGTVTLGSGGSLSTELTYETANSIVRPPSNPTETPLQTGVRIDWTAPTFGVVQAYTIYRSSDGATPIVIGTVTGNPPATEFIDLHPDTTAGTVVYTIGTTLAPVPIDPTTRQSPPSPPAVLKNDQSITLGALPISALVTGPSPTVTATAMSNGSPNGLQVNFSTTGPCRIANQSIASGVSSATVTLGGTGACTITAAQPGGTTFNAATSVSGSFPILPASDAQAIMIAPGPPTSAAFKSTFTVKATGGASGMPVVFTNAGPSGACTNTSTSAGGVATGVYTMTNSTGTCSVIANQAGTATFAPAPQVTKIVTATGPLVSVSPSNIAFGTVYLGSITTKTITVTNIGTGPLTVNQPLLAIVKGGNSNEFVAVNLCLLPLPAGKSCTITIAFVAGPFYTPQTATLNIMDNAPGSPQPVTLSATVIDPLVSLSPTSLNFGTIKHTINSSLNVTLSNPGATPLIFSGTNISVTGTNGKNFVQTNNCGSSLAAGAKCSIAVNFTPVTTGTFSANLTIVDNAQAGGGTQTVPLSGKGN